MHAGADGRKFIGGSHRTFHLSASAWPITSTVGGRVTGEQGPGLL